MGSKSPKGSKSRDSPQMRHAIAYPIKTLVFAILPPIEVLAKMAYGRRMKNTGYRVPQKQKFGWIGF